MKDQNINLTNETSQQQQTETELLGKSLSRLEETSNKIKVLCRKHLKTRRLERRRDFKAFVICLFYFLVFLVSELKRTQNRVSFGKIFNGNEKRLKRRKERITIKVELIAFQPQDE